MLRKQTIRYARLGGGALLVLIGVIGGFIPILQGWIFVLAGLTLMAQESRRARRLLDWMKIKVGATTKSAVAESAGSGPRRGAGGKGN